MIIENCPKCGPKLIKGSYYVALESLWFLLNAHLSTPYGLWFKANDEKPIEELCIKYSVSPNGSKCNDCGLMMIDPLPVPEQSSELPEFPFIAGKGI